MSLTDLLIKNEFIEPLDGVMYAVIGFAFVFIGIAILIAIITLVGVIMQKTGGKVSFKKKKPEVVVTEAAPVSVAEEEISDEVKAAIIAAIMAYYNAEKPKCEFVVKKIKRI